MPCYIHKDTYGNHIFICGSKDLGPRCRECSDLGDYLCDYPVGNEKTCDAPLCREHAFEVAEDTHYCPAHFAEWSKFVESGGIKGVLENVIPYGIAYEWALRKNKLPHIRMLLD